VSRRPPPPGNVRQAVVSGVAAFGLGAYYVDLYDERTLAAMKLAALLDCTAVRDVCDLDLLLPDHSPGEALLEWAVSHAGVLPEDASRAVEQKLAAMNWEVFQTQMLADPAMMERVDSAGWDSMRERVRKQAADLLDDHALRGEAS
jgi:hypothetical protein